MALSESQHPLIRHKIGLLRNQDVGTRDFRQIVAEIAALLSYEATADWVLDAAEVMSWAGPVSVPKIAGPKVVLVPILRAGLGMLEGVLSILPTAKTAVIGVQRDEETLQPHAYFQKLASNMIQRPVLVLDPMLATGGSAVAVVDQLKNAGCKNIRALFLIAAPEGIKRLQTAHPDVDIYIGTIDKGLNENGFILPGLGDAGDRIFGTSSLPELSKEKSASVKEFGGPAGPEPTRYGDWEVKGRCSDF